MKCEFGHEMKALFTSVYCPTCDEAEKQPGSFPHMSQEQIMENWGKWIDFLKSQDVVKKSDKVLSISESKARMILGISEKVDDTCQWFDIDWRGDDISMLTGPDFTCSCQDENCEFKK